MPSNQLSTAFVKTLTHSGRTRGAERHGDGGGTGLMINVQPGGSKSWVQVITIHGKRRAIGLGSYPLVGLAQARRTALENRRAAREGQDPRKPKRRPPRFREAAEELIDLRSGGWTNAKSRAQWESSLESYVYPAIGDLRIDRISSADVLEILTPIWSTKRETAARVRQRVSAVMRWGIANGHRVDDPASNALLQVLPSRRAAVRHYKALPYSEVPGVIARVGRTNAWVGTKLAFEFLVLTAARSGEVRGATWDEVDLEGRTWTIPAARMKARAEHRVPLAPQSLSVLKQAREIAAPPLLRELRGCPYVFPSARGKPLSNSTMSKLIRENGVEAVPHGFRSSFRDWASEQTDTPHAVMEAALAHTIPRAVEAAYARSDLFEKRRALMEQWASYVCKGDADG